MRKFSLLLALCLLTGAFAAGAQDATLVSAERIWDAAPHNAFTSLVRFNDAWYCAFREGETHASGDGALRVITSKDGENWTSAVRIASETADLRDAQLCVTPDGRLMLSGAAALHQPADARHQSVAYFSKDGAEWSEGTPVADPNMWLWRVTWQGDNAYGIGYRTDTKEDKDRFIRLYRSNDGENFTNHVDRLREGEYSNESCIIFPAEDTAYCLLRRDPVNGLFGISKKPYTEWEWKELDARIGGPCMIQIPDKRLVAAVRLYDNKTRTGLCWVDPETGKLDEFLTMPSGGDTSYPGLVWHDGMLWVSYYSSHEEKSAIYLAKVKLP